MKRFAAVVIGRNEAANLSRCLASVAGHAMPVVYVDSGSEDGSPMIARAADADVVELDRSAPFGVARSRNAGMHRVRQLDPDIELVQFVDGDSEMVATWFERAVEVLSTRSAVAIVCGRLPERHPHASLWHRLYALEWDPRLTDPAACGGMALVRVAALQAVGGFDASLVGFEDTELCVRVRQAGWHIVRLDVDMAIHDAGRVRLADWCARGVRTGFAYAQTAALHGSGPEAYGRRPCRSNWFWGVILPGLAMSAALLNSLAGAIASAAYPAFGARIYRRLRRLQFGRADAALYAAACVLSKFPQAVGQVAFHLRRWQTGPP